LSRFDQVHGPSTDDVVTTVGGPNAVASFGPAPSSAQLLADTVRRVRRASPPSGETDTGSDATQNDKQRRVINGNDSPGVQIIEGERHQVGAVEIEAEPRLRRFACSVGDCRRRYRTIDRLRTSLPPLRSCYLILSSCRSSLSAFGRPWRSWTRVTRVRAAQMVPAFRVDRGDSPLDCCT
jgi:hypothetical protein